MTSNRTTIAVQTRTTPSLFDESTRAEYDPVFCPESGSCVLGCWSPQLGSSFDGLHSKVPAHYADTSQPSISRFEGRGCVNCAGRDEPALAPCSQPCEDALKFPPRSRNFQFPLLVSPVGAYGTSFICPVNISLFVAVRHSPSQTHNICLIDNGR